MKIVDIENEMVIFETIKNCDIFRLPISGDLYMKISKLSDVNGNIVNSVRLKNGDCANVGDDQGVFVYPNACLTVV